MINSDTTYSVKITNPDNNHDIIFEKNPISEGEYDEIDEYCKFKFKRSNGFRALFYPIRTHNREVFAKDTFLPTVFNRAIKVQNISIRIFALLAAIVLDIVTIPIRLLTCRQRYKYNRKNKVVMEQTPQESKHPLRKYLKDEGVSVKSLKLKKVRVKLFWKEVKTDPLIEQLDCEGVSSHLVNLKL